MGSTSEDEKAWKSSKKNHAKVLKKIKFKDTLGPMLDTCETEGSKAYTSLVATKKPHLLYVSCLNKTCKTIDSMIAKMKPDVATANKELANCKKKLDMLEKTGEKKSREYSQLLKESTELKIVAGGLENVIDTLKSIKSSTSSDMRGASVILKILNRLK